GGSGAAMLSRAQALGRFVLAPMPRKARQLEARREKFAAFRAVDVAQQLWRELVAGSVVNDLARFQRDRARAVGQRVLDLMQRDEDGDAVLAVHVGKNVHDPTRGGGVERSDRLVPP